MEDLHWLFYVLLAVIILVVRMWLKAFASPKTTTTNRPAKPNAYPVPTPPATSYQEILKEMQASGNRAKKLEQPVIMENKSTLESKSREARSLEKTNSPARSLESLSVEPKPRLNKPSAIEITRHSKKQESYVPQRNVNYNNLLRNPQNVRTAFILSEIFNRRVDY